MSDHRSSDEHYEYSGNTPEGRESGYAGPSPTGYLHEQSWAERNGFPHWLLAFIWIIVSFVLFQIVGTAITVGYLIFSADEPLTGFDTSMIIEHIDVMLIGNSVSQILFLGLATWFFTGLSTSGRRASFLRFQMDKRTLPVMLQTVFLIVAIQPIIWLLSWINAQMPISDGYLAFEETQMEVLKNFLTGDHFVLITLLHVGLVPSVCEEVLYRGYVQRALEKSWGIWAAIILSGLLFGLYHIRLTQVIPLAVIGMLLAWIVWKSDSIFPAMAGHFVNNGGSVIAASMYPEYMTDQMTAAELPPVWLLLVSIGAAGILLRYIQQTSKQR